MSETPLTREEVERALPGTLKAAATDELTNMLNTIATDPREAELIRENFITYAHVLKDGKFRTSDFVSAIAFVSYKLMGLSDKDAYTKTFRKRHASMIADGLSEREISSFVAAYRRGQLVNKILDQTLIPVWVLHQDMFTKALRTQVVLMETSGSDLVRTQAANSVLTHLARPKEIVAKMQVSVQAENSGVREIRDLLTDLAEKQLKAIEGGVSTKEIAGQQIKAIEAEYEEVPSS